MKTLPAKESGFMNKLLSFLKEVFQPIFSILIFTKDLSDKLTIAARRIVGKYLGSFIDFGDLTGYVMALLLIGIIGLVLLFVRLI
ncbi:MULTISPECIES: hypothetical protein [Lentilactobacillus]|nr:hypothetical protein [Lentilactobacillus parabuchneri]MDN6435837.1 hypothetical protein [Lentilactobacillus parabuchneri]MDN6787283.1 hypothetical protein [Lentilactobacillus parabuchneri]